jgi:hypothetical protein
MPALKDEMVLQADGFIPVDPALGLRERAQSFVRSRRWSTPSIFYGDQKESDDSHATPSWSMTFGLGLDHVSRTTADWFSDVAAIVEFLQPIAREMQCEFILEFRLSSRLWYSESLGHIGGEPSDKVDIAAIRTMLQHFTKQRRSWWQRLIGR